MTVEISGPDGELVAVASQDIDLERSYPNGEACDGDGFVSGSLVLTRGDRV